MREVLTVKAGRNFQVIQTSCHARSNLPILSLARRLSSVHLILCLGCLQDELVDLAADPVFRNATLDMDVLYCAGETHHVDACFR
jgi:hypothetical protein